MRPVEPDVQAVPDEHPVAETTATLKNESSAHRRSMRFCIQRMSNFVTMSVDVANLLGL